MGNIRLSICIPTYNFGQFIGETLQSIIDQSPVEVEVVVVDGASTDNTQEIMKGFQQRHPWIRYHRLEKKGGIDHDMAKSVELAMGDYCWLMSSDDIIRPFAIQGVLDEINDGHDIYLCNRIDCDRKLQPVKNRFWLSEDINDRVFKLEAKEEILSYFDHSRSLGALFSYMSSIIVRRDAWNRSGHDERFNRTNYAHVFRLFSILLNGGKLKYLRNPLVLARGENDSFGQSGQLNRLLIDLRGYLLLASHLFSDHSVRHSFLRVMQYEHTWYDFMALKKSDFFGSNRRDFDALLLEFGYPKVKLFIVRIVGSSRILYGTLRCLWRAYHGMKSFPHFKGNSESPPMITQGDK